MTKSNANNFWDTDIADIESVFLPVGVKITDLPTTLDKRVPHQGSVLLDRIVNIDNIVPNPSFLAKVKFKLKNIFR